LVLPVLDDVLASQGASVRDFGVQVLFRHPTEKHRRLLADRFDDPHPDVRIKAREFLVKLAEKKEFRNQILAEGMRGLDSEGGRGQEQATLLLTQLDHKQAVGQFVKLLKAERPEVLVTAAWGLRKLAVKDTLAPVLEYAEAASVRLLNARDDPRLTPVLLQAL